MQLQIPGALAGGSLCQASVPAGPRQDIDIHLDIDVGTDLV